MPSPLFLLLLFVVETSVGVSRREELESSEFFFSVGGPDKDCRNGGDGCMYVRLGTTDKYNAVCQHACRVCSHRADHWVAWSSRGAIDPSR